MIAINCTAQGGDTIYGAAVEAVSFFSLANMSLCHLPASAFLAGGRKRSKAAIFTRSTLFHYPDHVRKGVSEVAAKKGKAPAKGGKPFGGKQAAPFGKKAK